MKIVLNLVMCVDFIIILSIFINKNIQYKNILKNMKLGGAGATYPGPYILLPLILTLSWFPCKMLVLEEPLLSFQFYFIC